MSDYTPITDFSAKDALSPGDPEKIILGADFDDEFDAIQTAVATKFDSADYASLAEAQAGTNAVALMTPERTQDWGDANAGIVGDLRALADPGVDTVLGWDDSASAAIGFTLGKGVTTDALELQADLLGIEDLSDPGADRIMFWDDTASLVTWLTPSTGITISGTNITTDDSAIVHDSLSGFVANEHIDHSAVSVTAGTGLSGGGTIAATRTLNLDISGLTALSGSGVAGSDGYLVDDGGTMKRIAHQSAGLPVNTSASSTVTLTDSNMNSIYLLSNAGAQTVNFNSGVGETGNFMILIDTGGTGTKSIGGTATVQSAFASDAIRDQYSVALAVCTSTNNWVLYGDCV